MLASDRSQGRADQRRRGRRRARDFAAWEREQPFDPDQPWDRRSAEALTRLYESEEGRLCRPAGADRARRQARRPADAAGHAAAAPETVDRPWMETHLTQLVERLQGSLAQANPESSFEALSGRLETIEQRFGATLGRVAQRADLEGLASIEAHVLGLTGQMERTRARLDEIGAVGKHVCDLGRRLDEAGEQRASGLEKLLRDCMAEWREGEQRTVSALQSIEEAVGRLGEAVDALEASRPAPELTVPALTGAELSRAPSGTRLYTEGGRAPPLYHATLDAADYATKPLSEDAEAKPNSPAMALAMAEGRTASESAEEPASGPSSDHGHEPGRTAGPKLTPGALRIMALRAKLRQAPTNGHQATALQVPAAAAEGSPTVAIKRASLSLLLMAGAAFLAGSTYLLYQSLVAMAPASPVMIERSAHPSGARSDLRIPFGRRSPGMGAS